MEPYIRFNKEIRKRATSDFEKDLYKLMNNSVSGKTMENLRKTSSDALSPVQPSPELTSSTTTWHPSRCTRADWCLIVLCM